MSLNLNKKRQQRDSIWVLCKIVNDTEYYIKDIDDPKATIWSNDHSYAIKFHTESGCRHFVKENLSHRTDIFLKYIEEIIEI